MPNVSFQAPTDYSTELQAIERRRKFAELLQQQGMQPLGDTQVVGGWAIPRSPLEGLAKALQQGVGGYQQYKSEQDAKDVATKYQTDKMRALDEGDRLLYGVKEQPPATPNDDEGNPNPVVAGVAPNPTAAIARYMSHPATEAIGMQERQRQMWVQALNNAQGGTSGGNASGGSGTPGLYIPRNIADQLLLADPTGKLLAQKNAEAYAESVKPQNLRPEGTLYIPGQGPVFTAPKGGVQTTWNNGQPAMAAVPNANAVLGAQSAAVAGGTASGQAPYRVGVVNTPGAPTLMTDQQQIEEATGRPMPVPGQALPSPIIAPPPASTAAPVAPPYTPGVYPPSVRTPQERSAYDQVGRAGTTPTTATVGQPMPAGGRLVPGLALQDQGDSARQKSFGTERGQLEAAEPQAAIAARTTLATIDRLNSVARELETHPGLDNIVGRVNQYSVTDLRDDTRAARALQGTLVKQSAVSALQSMRDASKTGGAVGQVTEREWPILEQQLAALDAAQSTGDYQVALRNLQNQMSGASKRIKAAYRETYGKDIQYESPSYETQGRGASGAWSIRPVR